MLEDRKTLPSISVIMPTLNAGGVLESCLRSIAVQDYPQDLVEIVVADGGSTDNTLDLVRNFQALNPELKVKIVENPLKTGEAGKAAALKHAKNDLVALIDSDNILPQKDWFLRMVKPFEDLEIIGAEPIEYTWRKEDGFITRYCALIGMNDPLVMFLGNYDRMNTLSGKWTELEIEQKDRDSYTEIVLSRGLLPTFGANGTILRRDLLSKHLGQDYFFDIDIIYDLANTKIDGYRNKFAKVKAGIVHLYCGSSITQFIRKQERRVRDYLYYEGLGVRKYPWRTFGLSTMRGRGLFFFVFSCLTVLPLVMQTFSGYRKKKDWAWGFHPLACWITLWVYGLNWIKRFVLGADILDREGYGQ